MAAEQALLGLVEATGRAVIRREHRFLESECLDNGEHIPGLDRMAEAVAGVLEAEGYPTEEVSALNDRLIEYGKQLFLDTWQDSLEADEDHAAVRKDGSRVFDHILDGGDPWAI